MKTTDYLIAKDTRNPKGLKEWAIHLFEYFLAGLIFRGK